MIRSERQLRVAQHKRDELREAAEAIGTAARSTYDDLAAEVQHEIDEYYGIRDGHISEFAVHDIGDLAHALVKARIARGWTQKQLADALDVTEQMVQKDEAGGYKRAGLTRLAEAADVLEYRLEGALRPTDAPEWTISVLPQPVEVSRRTAATRDTCVVSLLPDKQIGMIFGYLGPGDYFRGHLLADQIAITMLDVQPGSHQRAIASNAFSPTQFLLNAQSKDPEGSVP